MLNLHLELLSHSLNRSNLHSGSGALAASLIIFMACLGFPQEGSAHRQHLSWSTIEWNEQAKVLEITHRVHAHDASAWLTAQSNAEVDITDIEQQARFALYCAERFKIQHSQNWQEPELLGAELKGNFLLTYQQLSLTAAPASLFFETTILMDLFDDQEHVVNTVSASGTKSLSFNMQNTYQGVQL